MSIELRLSFINGLIAGAGVALSVMSIAFLQMTGPLEGKMGFSTIEIRVAIFLGFIIFAIAVLYEVYRKKATDEQKQIKESSHKSMRLDE